MYRVSEIAFEKHEFRVSGGGGAGSSFRGIICPPGLIWTDLPNSGGGASLLQCPKKALLIDHKLSFIFIL